MSHRSEWETKAGEEKAPTWLDSAKGRACELGPAPDQIHRLKSHLGQESRGEQEVIKLFLPLTWTEEHTGERHRTLSLPEKQKNLFVSNLLPLAAQSESLRQFMETPTIPQPHPGFSFCLEPREKSCVQTRVTALSSSGIEVPPHGQEPVLRLSRPREHCGRTAELSGLLSIIWDHPWLSERERLQKSFSSQHVQSLSHCWASGGVG